ncbi:MAG: nucleotidyltransferase family protein [Stomatobaculum sp.]|nr:nucleotidyltransferase family protein [Stomatobaculum sp.]
MTPDGARIAGIIAEYNPFHNGHLYQMQKSRSTTGAPWCIVLLSGSFVQRGEPALYSTAARAEAALRCGADAVFEIPVPFSTASARDYAYFGTALLSALGVSYIACGTEDASAEDLMLLAEAADESTVTFRSALREGVKSGLTYPDARLRAILLDLEQAGAAESTLNRVRSVLSQPNNILAFEYARAIRESGSSLKLVTTIRKGNGYHDPVLRGSFSSATALRQQLFSSGDLSSLTPYMPKAAVETFSGTLPLSPDAFCRPLRERVLQLKYEGRDLTDFADVSSGLSDRILRADLRSDSWNSLVSSIKTRQYTHTRISRALIHILLDITAEDVHLWKSLPAWPCARLLGFRRESESVLSALKLSSSAVILSKAADAVCLLGEDSPSLSLLKAEAYAQELWNSAYFEQYGTRLPDYYRQQIIVV